MGFRNTFRPRIGPFTLNFGNRGLSSIRFVAGPIRFRIWDANGRGKGRSRITSVDLPGPFSYRPSTRKTHSVSAAPTSPASASEPYRPSQRGR